MFQALLTTLAVVSKVATSGVTIGITPFSHPVQSQYHSQDEYGQYVYGYATPTASKSEAKTIDGVTRGGYSYIDSNGIVQTVQYIADSVNGFRVAATNLPVDLPEVAYAKVKHLADFEATKAEHGLIAAERAALVTNPIPVALPAPVQDLPEVAFAKAKHLADFEATKAQHAILAEQGGGAVVAAGPAPVQDLPAVIKARSEHLATYEATKARDIALNAVNYLSPIPEQFVGTVVPVRAAAWPTQTVAYQTSAPISYVPAIQPVAANSQYHAQDELGQYTYGYVNPLSSKAETKTADGITRGGYSYIDANGILQTVNYISDPVNGFRVAATNLPVAQAPIVAAPAPIVAAPAPVIAAPSVVKVVKTVDPIRFYSHEIVY